MDKMQQKRLERMEMRTVLHVPKIEQANNKSRIMMGIEPVIVSRNIRHVSLVQRKDENDRVRELIKMNMEGNRSRRRLRKTVKVDGRCYNGKGLVWWDLSGWN